MDHVEELLELSAFDVVCHGEVAVLEVPALVLLVRHAGEGAGQSGEVLKRDHKALWRLRTALTP